MLTFVAENPKKSAVKHSIDKPILLKFESLPTIRASLQFFVKDCRNNRQQFGECAKLRTLCVYVLYVLTHITYLSAFKLFLLACLHFFTCVRCPHCCKGLTCLHVVKSLHFLSPYVLFTYMLIKFTQINDPTYDYSSLLLLNSVIYLHLSSFFSSIRFESCELFYFENEKY